MSKSLLFWVIYVVAICFGIYMGWHSAPIIVLCVLIGLLGWGVFGFIVKE